MMQGDGDHGGSSPLRLFLCGDVMLGRGVDQILPFHCEPTIHEGYCKSACQYVEFAVKKNGHLPDERPPEYVWGYALEVLAHLKPDVEVINLETSVTTSNEWWKGKGINYRMHPRNVETISRAGIDVCVLGNNHVLDWGYEGLSETLGAISAAGIRTAGAGEDLARALEPAIVLPRGPGGPRVLVFSYGTPSAGCPYEWAAAPGRAGVAFLRVDSREVRRVKENIARHRQPGDIVVCSMHWGSNWGFDVEEARQQFAHSLIDDAGVHVVHGHSSHHTLGVEVWHGKLIIYGAGDFLSDYEGIENPAYEGYRDDLSIMWFPSIAPTGDLLSLLLVPTRLKQMRVNQASTEEAELLFQVLEREGSRFEGRTRVEWEGELPFQGAMSLAWS